MPFKIVQTKERGKLQLTIVPDKWEQNNILHWPKRQVEALLEQETSFPDDSWLTMKCQVKRTGLISKHSAEVELTSMLQESDTETEEITRQITAAQHINVNSIQHFFDDIVTTCVMDEPHNITLNKGESTNNLPNQNVVYFENIPQTSEQTVTLNPENTEIVPNILSSQIIVLDYVKNMENNILRKLSYLSAQIDTIAASLNAKSKEKTEVFEFEVIKNIDDLNNFERNLENPSFESHVIKHLSCICGKGKGRGRNNAYVLADTMFSRSFMTQCSWGGGSKSNINKLCFKTYKKTIELFFTVVHHSDSEYTKQENERFFKNIMRHASSRDKENIKRAPSSKLRFAKSAKKSTQSWVPLVDNVTNTAETSSAVNNITNTEAADSREFQPNDSFIIYDQHVANDKTISLP